MPCREPAGSVYPMSLHPASCCILARNLHPVRRYDPLLFKLIVSVPEGATFQECIDKTEKVSARHILDTSRTPPRPHILDTSTAPLPQLQGLLAKHQ